MANFQDYSWFKEKKNSLASLIKDSSEIIDNISLVQYAEGLRELSKKVDNDTFKIQIVGTFKNGKSTFINALLGEDILPTRSLPCTAVINEIKYGEEKRAILNFRNPLPETLLSDIPAPTFEHMKKHGMQNVPPMEIEYDRISDYVTIPIDGDKDEISLKSPYLSVELFYPSNLLKEGVEIIDSPGLNENKERTAVTLSYLDKADAIIYLLDATKACSQDEMETIDEILIPKGFDDMFFVVNRFDCIEEKEREDLKRFVKKHVEEYTTNEIFYISALQAVKGKTNDNDALYRESGLPPFESRLEEFLTKDKGRIKLTKPAKELKNILAQEALFKAIPSQRAQLSTNLDLLKERYESVKPELVRMESQKEALRNDLRLKVERKENNITRAIISQFRIIGNQVPAWIENYEPQNSPGVFAKKSQVNKVIQEISEYTTSKVKEAFNKWNTEVLVPMVEESASEMFEGSDHKLKDIFDGLDQLQAEISGTTMAQDNSSGWTRAIGVAGLCCGFASGASLLSGHFDIKHVAKSLAIDMGIGTGLLLLGITNPVIALAGVGVVVWNAIRGGTKVATKRIKEQLIPEIRNSIINGAEPKSEEIIKKIDEELQKSIDTAIMAIEMKIQDMQSQVQAVMAEKEKGEAYANERKLLLESSEKKLQQICRDLDSFVFELAEKV